LGIIGDKEVSERTVTVRKRSGDNMGPFSVLDFIGLLKEQISLKNLAL